MKTTFYETNKELVDNLRALELISEYLPVTKFMDNIREIINIHIILENYQTQTYYNHALRGDLDLELSMLEAQLTDTMDQSSDDMDILTLYTCGLALDLLKNDQKQLALVAC